MRFASLLVASLCVAASSATAQVGAGSSVPPAAVVTRPATDATPGSFEARRKVRKHPDAVAGLPADDTGSAAPSGPSAKYSFATEAALRSLDREARRGTISLEDYRLRRRRILGID